MKRKITMVLFAVAIVLFAFVVYKMMTSKPKPEAEIRQFDRTKFVQVDSVSYSDHKVDISGYGRVYPRQKIKIFSEVQGIMESSNRNLKAGNTFKKGELLVNVNDEQAKINLRIMKSDFLNLLTNSLADIKIDFPNEFPKWEKYLNEFSIENEIKDLPETNVQKFKYFIAARNIQSAFYSIKNAELNLSKHRIYAPFDGVVTVSNVEPGLLIRPGFEIAEFTSLNSYELWLPVPSDDVEFIKLGKTATIKINNEETVSGTISRIVPKIDERTQTITTVISFNSATVKEGQYLYTEIQGDYIKDSFVIPRRALLSNNNVNLIVDSKLIQKKVNVLKLSEEYAYIRGLDENDCVIIEPMTEVIIGMDVKPINNIH